MQTAPRFKVLHRRVSRFGYCADEFTSNGGWPHQFYVRVEKSMVGAYVMNENDVMQNGRRPRIPDQVAMGSCSSRRSPPSLSRHTRGLAGTVNARML